MERKKASVLAYKLDPEYRPSIESALATNCELSFRNDPNEFQKEVIRRPFDIVLFNFQTENGWKNHLLQQIKEHMPSTPVIVACKKEVPRHRQEL